jgi:SRSO17 transposase
LGGPESVLIFDESAFAKKGMASTGVARQWNGRRGKVDRHMSQTSMNQSIIRV